MNYSTICFINLQWEWVSSQPVCHSFILALFGMVIGYQSTSNRWIGPQLGWLSGAAVYAHVWWFMAVHAYPMCVLFLWTAAHLCYSFSSLIWIFSSLNHHHTAALFLWLHGLQSRIVYLWKKYSWLCYQEFLPCQGNAHFHGSAFAFFLPCQCKCSFPLESFCCERWGSVWDVNRS